ncbi:HPF/RaiA family ribosome-associated protein [Sulfuricella sp.]|uniref:HPF/RaiA family ribosome-associated protein n=1 Tax=Sulfuricella sp. TaxID=2099377 RepID=UPI002B7E6385|nr:HPF/RaiA family ribosome-associated protein [Sulfuricella sp.]HUX63481.1 HPF/RaiA family ribosome-associated protein [Sulfuricella sp.]
MQIHIQSQGFTLTDALRDHAEYRLRFGLTHASDHIRRVEMRLSDINGPRGGADKRCSIVVALESLPDVVIEDVESDLYVAIDRAADRASRSVARCLDRKREHVAGQRPYLFSPEAD